MRPLFIDDGYTETATIEGDTFKSFTAEFRPKVGPERGKWLRKISERSPDAFGYREVYSEVVVDACLSVDGCKDLTVEKINGMNDDATDKLVSKILGLEKKVAEIEGENSKN